MTEFKTTLFKLLNLDALITISGREIALPEEAGDPDTQGRPVLRCSHHGGEFQWYFADQVVAVRNGAFLARTAEVEWDMDAEVQSVRMTVHVLRPVEVGDLQ